MENSKHVWDLFWNMNLLRVQVVRGSKFQSSVKHYTWSSHYCCCRGGYIVWFMILHDYDLMRPSVHPLLGLQPSSCASWASLLLLVFLLAWPLKGWNILLLLFIKHLILLWWRRSRYRWCVGKALYKVWFTLSQKIFI